ncbi:MAG TPA: hypothetical protein VNN62_27415 [Methylomirabilota bacterium]|nr:hypothetical protein [Methylomirabilota bacterium]
MIDEAKRAELIAADPKSAEIIKPFLRGRDIKRWRVEWAGLYLKRRWEAVNAAEREELRATPIARKFQQLAALMASVSQLGWADKLAEEEAAVRDRWNRLKRILSA